MPQFRSRNQRTFSSTSELSEDDYYRILESKSVWIQNRVGPILKALAFQGDPGARKLLGAVEHFKKKEGAIDKTAPVTFLDPTEVAAVSYFAFGTFVGI